MKKAEALDIVLSMARELRETCKAQREDVEIEAIKEVESLFVYYDDHPFTKSDEGQYYNIDVKDVERHRGLIIGEDGTVKGIC